VTLFAPTDTAFGNAGITAVPTVQAEIDATIAILQYHLLTSGKVGSSAITATPQFLATAQGSHLKAVLSDGSAMVNSATVGPADINANEDAGVIHIIDQVLTIPGLPSEVLLATAGVGDFAVAVASLEVLDSMPSVSVFAPLDITAVVSLSDADLNSTLLLHIVPAVVYSTDLVSGESVSSLCEDALCSNLTITYVDPIWQVNGIEVVTTDILTSNGVIHVIESALSLDALNAASATTAHSFILLVIAAFLAF